MKSIGMLTVRNEVDVIDEFLDEVGTYFDTVVVMDDSTDGTYEKLAARSFVKYLVKFNDIYGVDGQRCDGKKKHLLDHIIAEYGYGSWVTHLNADAFFAHDPMVCAERAERQGKKVVVWLVYNFFPHISDEPVFEADPKAWEALRVQERLTWAHDHQWEESLQFRLEEGMTYDLNKHHRVLPEGVKLTPDIISPVSPILFHYPLRSFKQIKARRKDRLETGFRNEQYFKQWIDNKGFVRPEHTFWPEMKRWEDIDIGVECQPIETGSGRTEKEINCD